jgi:hypothetical protein
VAAESYGGSFCEKSTTCPGIINVKETPKMSITDKELNAVLKELHEKVQSNLLNAAPKGTYVINDAMEARIRDNIRVAFVRYETERLTSPCRACHYRNGDDCDVRHIPVNGHCDAYTKDGGGGCDDY